MEEMQELIKETDLVQRTVSFRREHYNEYADLVEKGYFTLSFSAYCKSAFAEKFQEDKLKLGLLKNENKE